MTDAGRRAVRDGLEERGRLISAADVPIINAIASNRLADPMRRMRARLVQHELTLADEAGDDGLGYRRKAWRMAIGLLPGPA